MRVLTLLAFIFLSVIGYSAAVNDISVIVIDITNQKPLSGIKIEFKTKKDNLLFTTTTNDQGIAVYENCKEKEVYIYAAYTNSNYSTGSTVYLAKYGNERQVIQLTNFNSIRERIKELSVMKPIDSTQIAGPSTCKESFTSAEFIGGTPELAKYLQKTIRYPERALDEGISGKVFLQFYVDPEGNVSNIKIIRGMSDCPDCDLEALEVLLKMPKWKPAECEGKKVGSIYNLPIKFQAM